MYLQILAGGFLASLSGCYTVSNERLSQDVRALVQPGMEIPLAIDRLEGKGFKCDPQSPAPAITCAKTQQSVLPYTCIERVTLMSSNCPARVERIAIPPIACAGF
jgi:hypothetical protein